MDNIKVGCQSIHAYSIIFENAVFRFFFFFLEGGVLYNEKEIMILI